MLAETSVDAEADLHDGILARPSGGAGAPWVFAWLGLAVALAYALLAPAEVNGDGIGYLKAARQGGVYPGHPAYLPLLRAAWWLGRALGAPSALAGGILPGRLLSASCAGLAVATLARLVSRRTAARSRGLIAGLGLAASSGFVLVGCDLESYAPALAALLLALDALDRDAPGQAGAWAAVAASLHIENALFFLPALLWRPRPRLVLTAAPIVLFAYVASGALARLGGATHGFVYPLHLYTPLVALWGALRGLVHAPYPYEASLVRVVLATTLAAIAAAWLLVLWLRGSSRVGLPRWVALAWLLPYALTGVAFFASDSERWLFLLPLVWLGLASRASPRPLMIAVATIAVANLALLGPQLRDDRGVTRARAVAARLSPGDLVISPGHGWDESIPLYADGVVPFPLAFYAAANGAAALPGALDAAIAGAAGHEVVAVRIDDPTDPSGSLGYKELVRMGIDRAAVRALVEARSIRSW